MRRLALAAIAAALPLSVVACGDDDKPAGSSSAAFCKLYTEADTAAESPSDKTPEKIKEWFSSLSKKIGDMVRNAPAELKAEAQKLADFTKTNGDIMAKVNYDPTKVSEADKSLIEKAKAEFSAAGDKIKAWATTNCKTTGTTTAGSPSTVKVSTTS